MIRMLTFPGIQEGQSQQVADVKGLEHYYKVCKS